MTKRIVLCADDYGQESTISRGIINLISMGRLSATSCMVNVSGWVTQAAWLHSLRERVDVGLHFNLTHGKALSCAYQRAYGVDFQPLGKILLRAYGCRLNQAVIAAELNAQLDSFASAMGCLPDFIDGHQHVHQFPIIRDALLTVYEDRLKTTKPYVRLAHEGVQGADIKSKLKKMIITMCGAEALKTRLLQQHIRFNTSFAGIYSFSDSGSYRAKFKRFLTSINNGGIVMCHPGLGNKEAGDPISIARQAEYSYLASEAFLIDCAAHNVALNRFNFLLSLSK